MSSIAELLERVKKAEGPDRELDAEIALALDWSHEINIEEGFECWRNPDGKAQYLPRLTASIDAIVALIERELPGWRYDLHSPRLGQECEGVLMERGESRRVVVGHAGTPALALCAAFLQAKEAQQ